MASQPTPVVLTTSVGRRQSGYGIEGWKWRGLPRSRGPLMDERSVFWGGRDPFADCAGVRNTGAPVIGEIENKACLGKSSPMKARAYKRERKRDSNFWVSVSYLYVIRRFILVYCSPNVDNKNGNCSGTVPLWVCRC